MTRKEVDLLSRTLKKHFGGKVEFEAVNGYGRYRFALTSKRFEGMTQLQRQDAVWAIVDQVLSREGALGVSIILAFAPADLNLVK